MSNLDDMRRYKITKALRRSYVKRRIVLFLDKHGYGYASEISHVVGSPEVNVCGAIRGMNNRYHTEDSLLSLGVISQVCVKPEENIKTYCLTSIVGQEAVRICRMIEKENIYEKTNNV